MTQRRRGQRLCARGYASIVRSLRDEPATPAEMALRINASANEIRRVLRSLLDVGVLRVAGWKLLGRSASPTRVYGVGDAPSAPRPLTLSGRPSTHRGTVARVKIRSEIVAFATAYETLRGPASIYDVVDEAGYSYTTAHSLIRHMRQIGLLGVAAWQRSQHGGPPRALYQLGVTRNATRPPRLAREVLNRRANERLARLRQQSRITHALASNGSPFLVAQEA